MCSGQFQTADANLNNQDEESEVRDSDKEPSGKLDEEMNSPS
jgi:hypothetical protein